MEASLLLLVCVILVALLFDVSNGMHDTANTVAPLLASRAASPRWAVAIVATCVALGAVLSGGAVAATIGSGIVSGLTLELVLAALAGAIAWNVLTWWLGIPCSSSLALVGGLVGAGLAATGSPGGPRIHWGAVADKVFVPSLLAPVVGGVLALAAYAALTRALRRSPRRRTEARLRSTQLALAGVQAFAQGMSDAQKTMGVVALAVMVHAQQQTSAPVDFVVPTWVVLACTASLTIGTLCGGWRVIGTMSRRIARLDVAQSVSATAAGAAVLLLTARFGMPVSTTYASVGSVLGAGSARSARRVNWHVAGDIAFGCVCTIPCAALVALLAAQLATAAPLVLTAAVAALIAYMLRRNARDGAAPDTSAPSRIAGPASPDRLTGLVRWRAEASCATAG